MKIIVLKENLKKAFSSVERAVGSGTMLPILKNVLIKTENGRIKIAATDLEFGITYWLNGKIVEEGGITVPAQVFGQLLNNTSTSKLELSTKDLKLMIKTDSAQNYLQGLKDDDFPIIPEVESKNVIEIKSEEFKKAVNQVVSAAANADQRPEMNGVLFWLDNNQLKLVATNGFRLAEKIVKEGVFKTEVESFKVIIPLKTIQEAVKLCENENQIKITVDSHQILFNFKEAVITSRLVEGNFPEYSDKIPTENISTVSLNKEELVNAVKLASVFVGKINDIKVKAKKSGSFNISSNNANIGENNSSLKAKVKGEDQELVLNWRYLLDGLKVLEGNEVELGLNGEANPVLIKNNKDTSYFYIIMPIKSGY